MEYAFGVRVLLVVTALLAAIIVGMATGLLARLGGAKLPACILCSGASVGATMTMLVLVMSALGVLE
ncbi:hypothetical protein ACFWN1_04010 [Streptomyces sp. NPDC058459]|uniref:hypothetical protein n=1 Tax=Streptomyces sp. NPDC058459 TaxID=3346508 RepID=UPI00365EE37F